jgi:phosphoribosyl 1,2-cyclic phosphodiesterase
MIEVCSLSSGSNGNAFFVKTGDDAFLVDAGISCKQICLRLELIGHHYKDLKGIFITHEHVDHTRGLDVLLKKHSIPVFISPKTFDRVKVNPDHKCFNFINSSCRLTINDTVIHSLSKSHDAVDPSLFTFFYKNKKISIITDVGHACSNVKRSIEGAHVLFLETNYDDDMLDNGIYPFFLKRRIKGRMGHLSNTNAGMLIQEHATKELQHVFLSHLSENNNTPDIALKTFRDIVHQREDLKDLNIIMTSRYEVSEKVTLTQ